MSKGKSEDGKNEEVRIEMNISKYLEQHGSEYSRVLASMLKRKYGGARKTVAEWAEELSEFKQRKVNV